MHSTDDGEDQFEPGFKIFDLWAEGRGKKELWQSFAMNVKEKDILVENAWIIPFCPLLSKVFKTHINVKFCNSVKSIKYI